MQLEHTVDPFLKWAGSKRKITGLLARFAPERLESYFEPFLGSGALFLHLAQKRPRFKAVLSDSNEDLISVYKIVRDNVQELIEILKLHEENYYKTPEEYFYYIRDSYNALTDLDKAGRLIFLNRTCYNGLYRVNKSGLFNVPHGTYNHPSICQHSRLNSVSDILNKADAEIVCADYGSIIRRCEKGDFVYLDPPYLPVTRTASFKNYTIDNFGFLEQIKLAQEFRSLSSKGCTVLLSNSNSPSIVDLYSNFYSFTISTTRPINCNASKRSHHQELLISNKTILVSKSHNTYAQEVRQMQ